MTTQVDDEINAIRAPLQHVVISPVARTIQPYFRNEGVTLYCGDWRDILPFVSGDVIVTDPPYGTGGWRRAESGKGGDPSGTLIIEAWDDGATDWLTSKPLRPVVTFWPPARTSQLLNAANLAGLTKHRALYMRKRDPKPQVSGRTKWSVEPIWVLSQDGFLLHGGDDVIEASTPRLNRDRDATGHPYQKPLNVMRWLLAKLPPCTIIDPFAGSGTTLLAAQELGMKAIGIEINDRYCEMVAKRLQQQPLAFSEAI